MEWVYNSSSCSSVSSTGDRTWAVVEEDRAAGEEVLVGDERERTEAAAEPTSKNDTLHREDSGDSTTRRWGNTSGRPPSARHCTAGVLARPRTLSANPRSGLSGEVWRVFGEARRGRIDAI